MEAFPEKLLMENLIFSTVLDIKTLFAFCIHLHTKIHSGEELVKFSIGHQILKNLREDLKIILNFKHQALRPKG